MTVEQVRGLLREGRRLRVVVGTAPDDPVGVLSLREGMVMWESVAGWSAGVVEPACSVESDYLATYLDKAIEVLEPGDSGWRFT
jgi:hypothetical protein